MYVSSLMEYCAAPVTLRVQDIPFFTAEFMLTVSSASGNNL
jgi:hypothetical protein